MDANRLRWAARRGMLELDLLLNGFLDRGYARLTAEQQAIFQRLLGCEDQDLFAWLLGHAQSPDPDLQAMVRLVRDDRTP